MDPRIRIHNTDRYSESEILWALYLSGTFNFYLTGLQQGSKASLVKLFSLLWDLSHTNFENAIPKVNLLFLCSQNQVGSDLSKFEEDSDGEEHYEDVKDEDVKDEVESGEEDSDKDKSSTSIEVTSWRKDIGTELTPHFVDRGR
jgi:hypothetical protein